jgi:Flp pilus assembly protein TadG
MLPSRGRRVDEKGDERGSAIVELTWLGLLLLVPLVYVIVTVFTVQRSAYGASEAVRAAARAYVLSPDVATANTRAIDAAQLSMRDQGVQLDADDVVIRCEPSPLACLTAGSSVVVAIALDVRLPLAPSVLGQSTAAISVRASHTERYSSFREGGR